MDILPTAQLRLFVGQHCKIKKKKNGQSTNNNKSLFITNEITSQIIVKKSWKTRQFIINTNEDYTILLVFVL